jgi:hypothetical protein
MCVNALHLDVTMDFLKYTGLMQLFLAKAKTIMGNVFTTCLPTPVENIINNGFEGITEDFEDDMKDVISDFIGDIEKRLEKMMATAVESTLKDFAVDATDPAVWAFSEALDAIKILVHAGYLWSYYDDDNYKEMGYEVGAILYDIMDAMEGKTSISIGDNDISFISKD